MLASYAMLQFLSVVTLLLSLAATACGNDSREWTPAVEVDTVTGGFSSTLTRAGEDSTLFVYLREPPEPFAPLEIVAAWLEPSGQWGSPTVVGTQISGFRTPGVATDDAGNAIVVWERSQSFPDENEIWARRYVAGEGWAPPEFVAESGTGSTTQRPGPKAALRPDGVAVVGWTRARSSPDIREVGVGEYVLGEGWVSREPWATGDDFVRLEAIGIDLEGRVVVAGSRFDEIGRPDIVANRFTPGVGWAEVSVFPGDVSFATNVEIDVEGTVWVLWPVPGAVCWGAARNTTDGWTLTEFNTPCEEGGNGAALSVDDTGGAVAVWTQGVEGPVSAYWSRYSEREGWSTPAPMPLGAGERAPSYALSARPGGAAVALWYRHAEDDPVSRLSVWASELSRGGQWSEPQLLDSSGPASFGVAPFLRPLVAVYRDGRAVGSWLRYRGPPSLEEFRRNDVTPWASEFR